MQKILSNINQLAFDHPWRIISAWLVLLALLATGAAMNFQSPGNSMTIPGTEAQRGIDKLSSLFPDAGKSSGRIVVSVSGNKMIHDFQPELEQAVGSIGRISGVTQVASPFMNPSAISQDGKVAVVQVQLAEEPGSSEPMTLEEIDNSLNGLRESGLTVEKGGDLVGNFSHNPLGAGELIGVGVALIVLLVLFGSLVAAGLPILTSVLAIGLTMAGLFSLSGVIETNTTTPAIAAMLGIAVGIDYSLFIINRYRSLVLEGKSYKEASGKALATSGSAVIFAAATVVVALAALSILQIPFITIMGLTAAVAVTLAALLSVTLMPVWFRLGGNKLLSRRQADSLKGEEPKTIANSRRWEKFGGFVTKHPVSIIVISLVAVGLMSIPAVSLELGMPTDQHAPADSTESRAYKLISDNFGEGNNAPLMVVVEGLEPVSDEEIATLKQQKIGELDNQLAQKTIEMKQQFERRLRSAQTPAQQMAIAQELATTQAKGAAMRSEAISKIESQINMDGKRLHLMAVADKVEATNNVHSVLPALVSSDGRSGVLQVIPNSGPSDQETTDLVTTLRSADIQNEWLANGQFTVTGSTAMLIDINKKIAEAMPVYLLTIVGISLILLVVAFRSVLVPIKATLGYLLSVAVMFGALVAVFQWGWLDIADAPGPIVSYLPLIALGILFGLAMDYEFFLVSSIKNEHRTETNPAKSIVRGIDMSGKVVTAAALIMVAVFSGFIANDNNVVQALGFALAVGVLVDAFIVRLLIVPAVMKLLGNTAWWAPKWLKDIIPDDLLGH